MHEFHGDLLIGGMAIRNVDGLIEEHTTPSATILPRDVASQRICESDLWSGRIRVDSCQQDALELGRQYLLLLDDGRNREVVLTDMQTSDGEDGSVLCDFSECAFKRKPR